jgi:D-alanyl-D-alanine carboxypeptidase
MADEPRRVTSGKLLPIRGLACLLAGLLIFLVSYSGQASAKPVAASIMVDAVTGEVLSSSNADVSTYPASLTKMMTLYLLFDALKHGQIKLTDSITFSDHAAAQDATNLAVSEGATIKVETAILAVVVRSANDAATAIGERLAGSEWAFAKKMTQTARALGMKNTTYLNANGLPNPGQRTTARDQAILAVALLRDFPEYYHYFAAERFSYRGVQYAGHNRVLNKLNGADGIKTGYIRAAGFNLVSSAEQNGRRLVGVVLGGSTPYLRDKQMVAMMNKGFKTPASGTGTMLALSAPNSAGPAKAPAVVAAAAPVSVPAALAAGHRLERRRERRCGDAGQHQRRRSPAARAEARQRAAAPVRRCQPAGFPGDRECLACRQYRLRRPGRRLFAIRPGAEAGGAGDPLDAGALHRFKDRDRREQQALSRAGDRPHQGRRREGLRHAEGEERRLHGVPDRRRARQGELSQPGQRGSAARFENTAWIPCQGWSKGARPVTVKPPRSMASTTSSMLDHQVAS